MKSFHWKLLFFAGILGVWYVYGTMSQPPIDPCRKISQSRPLPITQKLVGNMKVLIDGHDIARDSVVVQSGAPVAITGECRELTTEHPLGMIVIAYRKTGTPESSWVKFDHDHEWMYPKSPKFAFSDENRVNAEPGDYDLKVYVGSISIRTNMQVMEHVLDGHMKVIRKKFGSQVSSER